MERHEPAALLGVPFCDNGEFSGYMVCAETNAPVPEGMVERTVPVARHAMFDCVGPLEESMGPLQHRILTEVAAQFRL